MSISFPNIFIDRFTKQLLIGSLFFTFNSFYLLLFLLFLCFKHFYSSLTLPSSLFLVAFFLPHSLMACQIFKNCLSFLQIDFLRKPNFSLSRAPWSSYYSTKWPPGKYLFSQATIVNRCRLNHLVTYESSFSFKTQCRCEWTRNEVTMTVSVVWEKRVDKAEVRGM